MITCYIKVFILLLRTDVELKHYTAVLAEGVAITILRANMSRQRGTWRDEARTLVYRTASSQFVLTSGIMPSRCAMNSSGSTLVLELISTMSMAAVMQNEQAFVKPESSSHTKSWDVSDHYSS